MQDEYSRSLCINCWPVMKIWPEFQVIYRDDVMNASVANTHTVSWHCQFYFHAHISCHVDAKCSDQLDAHFICDGRLLHNWAPSYLNDFKRHAVVSTDGWIIDLPPCQSYGVSDMVTRFSINVGELWDVDFISHRFHPWHIQQTSFVVLKRSAYDSV